MLAPDLELHPIDARFILDAFEGLTVEHKILSVVDWAKEHRYLPPDLTSKPGRYDPNFTPYMIEIMDKMSPGDPATQVVLRKAAQIGATTMLENIIGHAIAEDPSGILYVSGNIDLVKSAMELKVDRMLALSNLSHLLGAPNTTKRSGDTAGRKEFKGGFLLAVGSRSAAKLRAISTRRALLDECDSFPQVVGGVGIEEGNVRNLVLARTATFERTRKVFYCSTPLKEQTSMINELFLLGDQNFYYVPCPFCGFFQVLDWNGYTDGGQHYGIVFELDSDGILIDESVGYQCVDCQKSIKNYQKTEMLAAGEWRPQSRSREKGLVSYHINAFYSPVGQISFEQTVTHWLRAWDTERDRMKDVDELQQFYNLVRGLPWADKGESPSAERVREHRRLHYSDGEVPNRMAIVETGAPVILLTCAVDVHKDRLDVEVVGWCQDRQSYSIEWLHFTGDPDLPETWEPISELIETKRWVADDGRIYGIARTLIDANYQEKADAVYQFCGSYSQGVYAIIGRKDPIKGSLQKEFSLSTSSGGHPLFNIWTSMYKDRFTAWVKNSWREGELQPQGRPNFPENRRDDYFEELANEAKFKIVHPVTKQIVGWKWQQIKQRPNHALDVKVYNMAAFDMIVFGVCTEQLKLEFINYPAFFAFATPRQNAAGKWFSNWFSEHPDEVLR